MDEVLDFQRWDEAEMCYKCGATLVGPRMWTGEGWRATLRSHESYVDELALKELPMPVLLTILTLFHEGVLPDVMHTVDIGMASHICANVFVEIMELGVWGSNQQKQLEGLQGDLDEWYACVSETCKVQGLLTLARIRTSGDWPKLAALRH